MTETRKKTDNVGDIVPSRDDNQEITENLKKVSEIPETMETDLEDLLETTNPAPGLETPEKNQQMTSWFGPSHTGKDEEDKEEVTSPDVIPSSQVSDSPGQFKSLRRSGCISVRNSMVVLLKDVNDKDKNNTDKIGDETVQVPHVKSTLDITDKDELMDEKDSESQEKEVKGDDKVKRSSTKVTSSKKKKKSMAEKPKTSPVAGRTRRRGRQLKLGTLKKDGSESSENNSEEATENSLENQESSSSTQDADSLEVQGSEINEKYLDSEKPEAEVDEKPEAEVNEEPEVEPTKTLESLDAKIKGTTQSLFSKDVMSSPVSCAKIKFMKPNTGSPTQPPAIKTFHSPVSSPSTGILKRCTGRYNSPSPPNKVSDSNFNPFPHRHRNRA